MVSTSHPVDRALRLLVIVGAASFAFACGGGGDGGDENGPFPGGFLGLADVQRNTTRCGECHSGQQADWVETAHANAYDTLAAIGQEAPTKSCAPCHNVSDKGNWTDDPSYGYVGTPVEKLRNVQCENCHGPGAEHLADPSDHPNASIAVSLTTACGECHQDEHHPFVEEWQESAHARSDKAGQSFGLNVAADPECAYCHVAQSFIRFIESGGTEQIITSDPQPLTCVACHDPHGNGNKAQVRVLGDVPLICAQCHQQGPTTIGEEPHHPQADMLLGTAGYRFPGVVFPGASSHGNINTNPDLCVTCHVVTRAYSGGEVPTPARVGHTFEPIPVIDPATGERDYTNCLDCHADPGPLLTSLRAEVNPLIEALQAALDAVPEEQRETDTYKGALFNLQTVENDLSVGVHNPPLSLKLLEVSIEKLGDL